MSTLPARLLPLLFLTVLSAQLLGQDSGSSMTAFNRSSLDHQRTAMLALGGWAVTNIGIGLALRGRSEGSTRHFHEMNALWNTVNLAIAGFGYYSVLRADPGAWDLATSLAEHGKFQKILLFNAGLDVGYVLGGLYLTERAKRPGENGERLTGFGRAIMLQGAFLFAFDLVNYVIATRLDETVLLAPATNGIGLLYTF